MARNNGFLRIFNFISKIIDDRIAYKNLKSDECARQTTSKFGKSAIGYSIGFSVLSVLGAICTAKGASGELGIIVGLFAIIIGAVFLLVAAELLFFAVSHTVKQLALNRRAVSFIALAVLIIGLAVSFFLILKYLGSL